MAAMCGPGERMDFASASTGLQRMNHEPRDREYLVDIVVLIIGMVTGIVLLFVILTCSTAGG